MAAPKVASIEAMILAIGYPNRRGTTETYRQYYL
jgi:hypothetical protein